MSTSDTRFFQAGIDAGAASVELDADNARIARDVLRLKPGDTIEFVNGSGLVIRARINHLERKTGSAQVTEHATFEPSRPALTLLQGIPKGDKAAWIVQKAVEWGLAKVVFVETEHSVPHKRESAPERWRKVAVEALRQSGNPFLPEVSGPIALEGALVSHPAECSILFDEKEKERLLRDLLSNTCPASLRIAVGPEGGWSDAERSLFRRAGFQSACLAPYVLRTETAAISAVAAVHTLLGGRPPAKIL
jgi:16S rRNA (uracil1498-N3)-methyltransferase